MTTIAYRDGILAADTRAFSGSTQPIGEKQKIYRIKGGSCFGVSTPHPGLSEEIKDWFVEAKHLDHEPQLNGREFDMLEIDRNGEVFFYHNSFVPAGPLAAEYFAIGSGSEYAMGAMGYGASAVDAVAVAAVHDVWTGPTVTMIEVPKKTSKEAAA
jgi:hypothetical protein